MARTDADFDTYLQQRIEAAFGLDEMTPEERACWDAYDRAMEAFHRYEEAAAARVIGNAKAVAAYINANPSVLDELMPGASAAVAEHGLRFAWEASGE